MTRKSYVEIATGRLISVPWMRHFQRSLRRVLLTFVLTSPKSQFFNYLFAIGQIASKQLPTLLTVYLYLEHHFCTLIDLFAAKR